MDSLKTEMMELGFQIARYPLYSLDLAPSDYYLIPNMKEYLTEKSLYSNSDVIAETKAYNF